MTKRYGEPIDMLALRPDRRSGRAPAAFRWRGRTHRVVAVLGYWCEDAAAWGDAGIAIPQRDLWRVETDTAARVCEVVREGRSWTLARIWD